MNSLSPRKLDEQITVPVAKKRFLNSPPLGWNSYDSYQNSIGEEETLRNLDIFAEKLAPFGYEYFVIDLGWYSEIRCFPNSLRPWGNDAFDYAINEYGYPVSCRTYFPNGIERIADRAHSLGVKFGLHLMRGVLRKAWEFNMPVEGTAYRLRDIADTNSLCSWSDLCYGVDMTKPGAQEYYDGFIRHIARMGVDFLKVDDIVPWPAELEAVGKAVARCDRDIVLSLSPGDDTVPENKQFYSWGHMLRITCDVWDYRHTLDECFRRWRDWQGAAEADFWPDMDMLCLGTLNGMSEPPLDSRRKLSPAEIVVAGTENVFWRTSRFTAAQERTFITMRAMSASPLFMGGCLIRTEQRYFDLITHPDVLACNQNGVSGTLQSEGAKHEVWRTPSSHDNNRGWIGLFNRSELEPVTLTLTPQLLGLPATSIRFRNIWDDKQVFLGDSITVAADDVLFIEYNITD